MERRMFRWLPFWKRYQKRQKHSLSVTRSVCRQQRGQGRVKWCREGIKLGRERGGTMGREARGGAVMVCSRSSHFLQFPYPLSHLRLAPAKAKEVAQLKGDPLWTRRLMERWGDLHPLGPLKPPDLCPHPYWTRIRLGSKSPLKE